MFSVQNSSGGCLCPYCGFHLGQPTLQFAEQNMCGWIAQPANTISNIAYLFVTLILLIQLRKNTLPWYLYGFPIAYSFIGISSGFYHASSTFVGQFLDFTAIYVFVGYILFLAINKRNWIQTRTLAYMVACSVFLLSTIMWFVPFLRIWLFAIFQIIPFLWLEFTYNRNKNKQKRDVSKLKYAVLIFLVAWAFWWLDILLIWDYKSLQHIINGHAAWHVLTAVSLYFVAQFYLATSEAVPVLIELTVDE